MGLRVGVGIAQADRQAAGADGRVEPRRDVSVAGAVPGREAGVAVAWAAEKALVGCTALRRRPLSGRGGCQPRVCGPRGEPQARAAHGMRQKTERAIASPAR